MAMMSNITKPVMTSCQNCQRQFELVRFENLIFGIREDCEFCVPCYQKNLDFLVKQALRLGENKYFFGRDKNV